VLDNSEKNAKYKFRMVGYGGGNMLFELELGSEWAGFYVSTNTV